MHREIASLELKLKDMEEIKASSCVEEGNEPQRDARYQFGGFNHNSYSRCDWIIGNLSLWVSLLLSYLIFMFQSVAQRDPEKKLEVDSPNELY